MKATTVDLVHLSGGVFSDGVGGVRFRAVDRNGDPVVPGCAVLFNEAFLSWVSGMDLVSYDHSYMGRQVTVFTVNSPDVGAGAPSVVGDPLTTAGVPDSRDREVVVEFGDIRVVPTVGSFTDGHGAVAVGDCVTGRHSSWTVPGVVGAVVPDYGVTMIAVRHPGGVRRYGLPVVQWVSSFRLPGGFRQVDVSDLLAGDVVVVPKGFLGVVDMVKYPVPGGVSVETTVVVPVIGDDVELWVMGSVDCWVCDDDATVLQLSG